VLAPFAGLLAIVPLLFVCAVVLVFAEIALHLFLRPGAVRNVKAVASLASGLTLFGALQSRWVTQHVPPIGGAFGRFLDASPFGLVARVFLPRAGESPWSALGFLCAEAAVVFVAGDALLAWLVRSGVVVGGVRTGAGGRTAALPAVGAGRRWDRRCSIASSSCCGAT
jgi:hypothetical protein